MKRKIKNFYLKKENIYFFFAAIGGLLMTFLMPPFEVPDENAHYYKAWELSGGQLFCQPYEEESNRQLIEEIREAREISGGKGPLGVNVMVALTNYESLVRTAVKEGVEFIISGAGIPRNLPAFVNPNKVSL